MEGQAAGGRMGRRPAGPEVPLAFLCVAVGPFGAGIRDLDLSIDLCFYILREQTEKTGHVGAVVHWRAQGQSLTLGFSCSDKCSVQGVGRGVAIT